MPANCITIVFRDGVMTVKPQDFNIRLRRSTREKMSRIVFLQDEFVYMTDTKEYYRGDGVTPGGLFFAKE